MDRPVLLPLSPKRLHFFRVTEWPGRRIIGSPKTESLQTLPALGSQPAPDLDITPHFHCLYFFGYVIQSYIT